MYRDSDVGYFWELRHLVRSSVVAWPVNLQHTIVPESVSMVRVIPERQALS